MNMAHPITPTLLTLRSMPPVMNGMLYAAMSAMLAISSPLVAWLGMRISHRRIVQASFAVYLLGQAGFALMTSPMLILFSRAVSGLGFAGISGQLLSYLMDATNEENRKQYLVFNAATMGISVAGGYLLEGLLGNRNIFIVFWCQLILISALFLFAPLLLDKIPRHRSETLLQRQRPCSPTALLIVYMAILFLAFLASTCYDNALNYYIKAYFFFTPVYNGWIKALTGVTILVANCTISVYFARRLRSATGAGLSFTLCAICMLLVLRAENLSLFVASNMLFCAWNATQLPMVQEMLSSFRSESAVGMYNTIRGVGMVLGSMLSGILYEIGPKFPFILCTVLYGICVTLCLIFYRLQKVAAG